MLSPGNSILLIEYGVHPECVFFRIYSITFILISAGPYPGFFLGGPIEHRRRENRGVEGVEGAEGGCRPSPLKIFFILNMKMVHFGGVGVKIRLPISPIQKRPRFHALITIG
jgi:hypothetical protein